MYNRAFPVGNALFFFTGGVMSLFRLPRGKLPLSFLTLEKSLYLREQDTGQGVHFMDRYPGAVVVDFLFPCHRSRPQS